MSTNSHVTDDVWPRFDQWYASFNPYSVIPFGAAGVNNWSMSQHGDKNADKNNAKTALNQDDISDAERKTIQTTQLQLHARNQAISVTKKYVIWVK